MVLPLFTGNNPKTQARGAPPSWLAILQAGSGGKMSHEKLDYRPIKREQTALCSVFDFLIEE